MNHRLTNYDRLSFVSSLGPLVIAADERGIAELVLPGCRSRLRGPERRIENPDVGKLLQKAAGQIDRYLQGISKDFTLPLAPAGTAFQMAVWRLISAIPYGETMTYGELGRMLGGGGKARAVGNAAGANPLPLLVPCHRVVGARGELGGFAGGTGLKLQLLKMEKESILGAMD